MGPDHGGERATGSTPVGSTAQVASDCRGQQGRSSGGSWCLPQATLAGNQGSGLAPESCVTVSTVHEALTARQQKGVPAGARVRRAIRRPHEPSMGEPAALSIRRRS